MRKFHLSVMASTVLAAGCSSSDVGMYEPVIPVSLKGIETVNIDNAGEFPQSAPQTVKKEAYMLGVKWIADNTPTDDDKFITGPIAEGERTYRSIADGYSKAIMALTPFNSSIPAGKYVSKFFKRLEVGYLPAGVDEGFALLVAPDPGTHSFRVEYYQGDELKFSHDTQPIEFK